MRAGDEQNMFDPRHQCQSGHHSVLNPFQRGTISEPALSNSQVRDDLVEDAAVGQAFGERRPYRDRQPAEWRGWVRV